MPCLGNVRGLSNQRPKLTMIAELKKCCSWQSKAGYDRQSCKRAFRTTKGVL